MTVHACSRCNAVLLPHAVHVCGSTQPPMPGAVLLHPVPLVGMRDDLDSEAPDVRELVAQLAGARAANVVLARETLDAQRERDAAVAALEHERAARQAAEMEAEQLRASFDHATLGRQNTERELERVGADLGLSIENYVAAQAINRQLEADRDAIGAEIEAERRERQRLDGLLTAAARTIASLTRGGTP